MTGVLSQPDLGVLTTPSLAMLLGVQRDRLLQQLKADPELRRLMHRVGKAWAIRKTDVEFVAARLGLTTAVPVT